MLQGMLSLMDVPVSGTRNSNNLTGVYLFLYKKAKRGHPSLVPVKVYLKFEKLEL